MGRGEYSLASSFSVLNKVIRDALAELGFRVPTEPQRRAIEPILKGENVLLIAPSGTGKTEAALLPVLNNLLLHSEKPGIGALYVTPLRALNRDLMRRLSFWASRLGLTVEVRHGDTPEAERRQQVLKPPDLLITTPETLQAILPGKRMRRHLRSVRHLIVDEIHELAEDKRGAQFAVALERLEALTSTSFQRIGLSATVGSPREIAKFLVGIGRRVRIIKVPIPKEFRYKIEFPYPSGEDYVLAQGLYTTPEAAARLTRLRELISNHGSMLIFVNSRTNAEMLSHRLRMLQEAVEVHHGSLSREERERIEGSFKAGSLRAIVCTSTLELGIDVGSVDLVVQYMSPRRATTLLQRIGRSGHGPARFPEGIIITAFPEDVLESIVVVERAKKGRFEPVGIHFNAQDVLAHQLAGLVLDKGSIRIKDALRLIRRAYPYKDLDLATLLKVTKFMESLGEIKLEKGRDAERGRKGGLGNAPEERILRGTARTKGYYYENLSMIPDERRYPVLDLSTGDFVATLGDEFVQMKAKVGLNFICKGRVWRIEGFGEKGEILVTPVEDPTAAIPGWDGELLPLPRDLAQDVGNLRAFLAELVKLKGVEGSIDSLATQWPTDRLAIRKVIEETVTQIDFKAPMPTKDLFLLEAFRNFLIFHSCQGEQINRALGYILSTLLERRIRVRGWWADSYRVLLEAFEDITEEGLEAFRKDIISLTPEGAEGLFYELLEREFPFAYYMKFVAERFGALPRGLFIPERKFSERYFSSFLGTPIYEETLRYVLKEKVDLGGAKEVLRLLHSGKAGLHKILDIEGPSPLALGILNKFFQAPELMAPESSLKDSIAHMRTAIAKEYVELFCLACLGWNFQGRVEDLPEEPRCQICGSGLLAVMNKLNPHIREALDKKRLGIEMTESDREILARARRTADLVLSYGKKGVIALMVTGIGPQTASRILALAYDQEEEFYRGLIDAKLRYLTTREYWKSD
ncbi:DEAD/DEAH box helicase [Candidatus Bathyarchaeota archaeon]|nr:DEAD/DEAH box helicase [Candidatus Bathyarchaeota archaeon]